MSNKTAKIIAIWASSAIAISVAIITTKSAIPIWEFVLSCIATEDVLQKHKQQKTENKQRII